LNFNLFLIFEFHVLRDIFSSTRSLYDLKFSLLNYENKRLIFDACVLCKSWRMGNHVAHSAYSAVLLVFRKENFHMHTHTHIENYITKISVFCNMCILLHKTISGFLCIISKQIFRSPSSSEINRNNRSIPLFDVNGGAILIIKDLYRKIFLF